MDKDEFEFNENDLIKRAVIVLPSIPKGIMHAITKHDAVTGLFYRIDQENEGTRTQRHIHIWAKKKKHAGVSWNFDGSRHDKGHFKDNFKHLNGAKDLAARMLNPSPAMPFEILLDLLPQSQFYTYIDIFEIILEILLSPNEDECIYFDLSKY